MRAAPLLVVLLSLVVGCAKTPPRGELLKADQVPEALLKIAREKLPSIAFDHFRKKPDGTYVIRGKDDRGKVREIELSADGKVLDLE